MSEHADEDTKYASITSNLAGGGTVRFDIPDTSASDTKPTDPIVWYLTVFPTASEGTP